jgi:hypothetical protein
MFTGIRRKKMRIVNPSKNTGTDFTMVRFRKPGHKGETWYVSVNRMGGGPYTKDGINLKIPATFTAEVTQHVANRYAVYSLAEFSEKILLKDIHEHPLPIRKRLFKKAEAFCTKHGYVNVDPRWK